MFRGLKYMEDTQITISQIEAMINHLPTGLFLVAIIALTAYLIAIICSAAAFFVYVIDVPPLMVIKYSYANAYSKVLSDKLNLLGQFVMWVLVFIPICIMLVPINLFYLICCLIGTIGKFLFCKRK